MKANELLLIHVSLVEFKKDWNFEVYTHNILLRTE